MRLLALLLALTFVPTASAHDDPDHEVAIAAAFAVLDEYLLAFNARDETAWAATLNYPHYRFVNGTVGEWKDAREYADAIDLDELLSRGEWSYSHWLTHEVTLASPNKVHVLTTLRRYSAKHEPLATFRSLYVVTKEAGRWGIKFRSSLAPDRTR